ncbi:PTS transporter subunit EIIB [uncultured Aquitalea sp.]|uniref:PTS transporter subunit EIIB n=1 Tax=uncultured Aquitalea sp. TaxID=540272 RepID=UPI0025D27C76|nr:PTS transporter subunit EIIB [uncultured Aquitalea sp.]
MTEQLVAILAACGGAGDIRQSGNCMARLRLTPADSAQLDRSALKQVAGVLGVIDGEGQLQIVLGPAKAQRAAENLAAMAGARIEQRLRRAIPDNLDVFLTPLITLLLAGTPTYLAIKPLGVVLFDGMS